MGSKITKHNERYKVVLERVSIERREEPEVFTVSNERHDASYAYFLRQKSSKPLSEYLEKVVSCAIDGVMRDGMPRIGCFDFPNKVSLEITLNLDYRGIGYMDKLRNRDYKIKKKAQTSKEPKESHKPKEDPQQYFAREAIARITRENDGKLWPGSGHIQQGSVME